MCRIYQSTVLEDGNCVQLEFRRRYEVIPYKVGV